MKLRLFFRRHLVTHSRHSLPDCQVHKLKSDACPLFTLTRDINHLCWCSVVVALTPFPVHLVTSLLLQLG
eukprot:m.361413 g.361413  ORF g.361413 m.361413 type:complete len:70 (-) comp19581_c0_seq1:407-616(-)